MKTLRPYLVFILALIVFFILFFVGRASNKITIENPSSIDTWNYEGSTISLPVNLKIQKNTPYTISYLLDESFHEPQYIMIRTSLANVKVHLGDELIYEETYGMTLDKPFASMWHFVRLPRHIDGQTLTITFESPYTSMSGQINEIFYGPEVMHLTYLVRTYGLRFLIASIIFIIGLLVTGSTFIMTKKQDRGFAYIGLFAIFLSQWMMAESRLLQFFTGSELLIGSLAYLSLTLFPIPLIYYLREHVLTRFKKPLNIGIILFSIQFFLVVLFYIVGFMDFFESVIITHVLLGVSIIVTVVFLSIEIKENHNINAMNFIKIFIFLTILALLELINFALGNFKQTSVYLSIGLAFLSIILLYYYSRYLLLRVKLSHESEVYEKLAYIDYITQGQNRLAFERDIENIYFDPDKKIHLRLIMFDLDNLKAINDAYGHVEGDRAIKETFKIISEVFKDHGTCYRIGGDEFACLYLHKNHALFEEKKKILQKHLDAYEDATPYHFGLSLGSAIFDEDKEIKDLLHEADLDMYEYKKTYKKTLHEDSI